MPWAGMGHTAPREGFNPSEFVRGGCSAAVNILMTFPVNKLVGAPGGFPSPKRARGISRAGVYLRFHLIPIAYSYATTELR